MAPAVGLEPTTQRLTAVCAAIAPRWNYSLRLGQVSPVVSSSLLYFKSLRSDTCLYKACQPVLYLRELEIKSYFSSLTLHILLYNKN